MSRVRAPSGAGQSGPAAIAQKNSPSGNVNANLPSSISGPAPLAPSNRGGGAFNQFDEKFKGPDEQIEERVTFDLQRVSAHGKDLSKKAADRRGKPTDFSQRDPETGKFISTKDVMDAGSPDSRTIANSDNDPVGRSIAASRPEQAATLAFNSSPTSSAGSASLLAQNDTLPKDDRQSGEQGNSFEGMSVASPTSSGGGGPSRGGGSTAA